ncbi:hypothetical protein [Erythrobacter dokdonensis]|uniref:Uncharacterized protein n=1 Tax=Erythrobacter dokdonensis DSW-74 TaxID=1300349 RepID=A0A1A7BF12_9SPHN|nr:hypothetical protein [Erythrobacter dokdonensis]OBV09815.1 hypothetical protein I603_2866 [Erythrobacter dokdonensis DSW-74]
METPPLVLQTAGSLVAILALAGLAWWLKLGGAPLLDSDEAVRRAAHEAEDGFAPMAIARDTGGLSALALDDAGRIMVIKRHGNRFAGRVLGPNSRAMCEGSSLVVDCGEARFGAVVLSLPDAQAWADAINRLNGCGHA